MKTSEVKTLLKKIFVNTTVQVTLEQENKMSLKDTTTGKMILFSINPKDERVGVFYTKGVRFIEFEKLEELKKYLLKD